MILIPLFIFFISQVAFSSNCNDFKYNADRFPNFLKQCESVWNRKCIDDSQCDGFPCVKKACLIKLCKSDRECPNGLCGRYLTPTPGFCTSSDVK